MKLRKTALAVLAASALFAGAGTSHAAAGWQYVGGSEFTKRDDTIISNWFTAHYVYSGGGDFQACVAHDNDSYTHGYTLWEQDSSTMKKVATKYGKQGDCFIFRDIGAYVDGDNNKAEFRLSTDDPEGGYEVLFWD
ncbi:hypothetical protein Stsp02_47090 [Streptomyces sp. NBRC 14336]|uniref:hypothetical protein n=1 Tax=Streptomyces sp. NBRC 14336 TaxID=3030992 RepID=UPI0024A54B90|nr:hypothetical protein [Streptomyces sp. NBRC 14336]WBO79458.1 hypothetical protein SBE_003161 [Streptomyces sp. SBE_14.2]GLW49048.1 hypothetical protein Stsp02_47090 [Streptomyces sp. NBRC 14336]